LLLTSNCFADTNSTGSYNWVNKTIDVCKVVGAVVKTVSEIGLALLFLDFGFRELFGRTFNRLRQTEPTLLEHESPQQSS
jgi:choline-glycine betaine transporter